MAASSNNPGSLLQQSISQKKFNSPEELRVFWKSFLAEFASNATTTEKYTEYSTKMKHYIFYHGIPPETKEEKDNFQLHGTTTLRGEIWRILLRVDTVDLNKYTNLLAMQNSKFYSKIKLDTNRTFTQDAEFSLRVKEDKLIRVLNAFQHYQDEKADKEESPQKQNHKLYYSQGMNLFAGMFLYVMPEPLAFWAYTRLIEERCPRYSGPIEGPKEGLILFEKVFEIVDPTFFKFIQSLKAQNELHAYVNHSIVSLMSSVPPLEEAMKLFDVLLAWGVHLAILFAVSNLVLRRRDFFDHPEPKQLLMYKSGGSVPPINARAVLNLSWELMQLLPENLFTCLVLHPSLSVANQLSKKTFKNVTGTR